MLTIKQMSIRLGLTYTAIYSRMRKLYPEGEWEKHREFSDEDYEKIKLMGR